ncbi:MAG: hypothetical protein KME30_26945 [Iphinoe sp. HA4291-MV1]|jgi:hypothetical protein|nr:hypothetical protein [Iphinoe sp. HA4291-MV1]
MSRKNVNTSEQTDQITDTPIEEMNADTHEVKPPKPKKERIIVPKKEVNLVIDAGRSRIKFQSFVDGQSATPVIALDSLVCQVDSLPFGELGAFAMSRGKDDNNKDIVESWVIGNSARFQQKQYVAMSEGENHKVDYFPVLVLGAVASLPNLYDLSTGANEKTRTLTLRLSTLSLASPFALKSAIERCKWIAVDGVKYKLSFGKSGFLGFPEGYGAALHTQSKLDSLNAKTFYTFDIGFGTSTLTEYSNLGKLPKRGMCSPNGGGGIATLIREFSEQISNSDSSRIIRPSQLREILETSTIEDGKVGAVAPDGRFVGDALEVAIKAWIKDSPLTYALEKLGTSGRRHPVTLCGGGFAIPPVRELVCTELLRAGIPENNLLIPEEPGTVALSEMRRLYTGDSNSDNEQQTA